MLVVDSSPILPPAERLRRQIGFIIEADKLKEIFRQTLVTQSRRAENSAEHSWHFALMVIVLAEHSNHQPLDVLRVLKMVLIHDIVEIDAGDLPKALSMTSGWLINVAVAEWVIRRPGIRRARRARSAQTRAAVVGSP